MLIKELSVAGAFEVVPRQFDDPRGTFAEWFRDPDFRAATGHGLRLSQANCSTSSVGALRGIHFAAVPPGQAKYVFCPSGAVFDVVVDLRIGSPTFGSWDGVVLDDVDRRAVYLSEGLGHGFLALSPGATVVYLCSEGYAPQREHGIHPLDPDLAIDWPDHARDGSRLDRFMSDKDAGAPSLVSAQARGLLPTALACADHVRQLRLQSGAGPA